jgi:hypothetical protein
LSSVLYSHKALILNVDELLGAGGGVGDVDLHGVGEGSSGCLRSVSRLEVLMVKKSFEVGFECVQECAVGK